MVENSNFDRQVAVFGGEGNMGKLTANLFQDIGYETLSVDPRNPESPPSSEAITQSRIIFFSILPVEKIREIIKENSNLFDNHIILDNASIKKPFAEAYRSLDAQGVSICSTHPMCKHDQPLYGQKALVLDVGTNSSEARELAETLYTSAGMVTIPLSFESHDRTMAVVQFLPHVVMRSIGRVLEKESIDPNLLREIAPANFQLFYLSMWRTLVQDPKISSTIITNILKNSEGQTLANEIQSAIEEIISNKDVDDLTNMLEETFVNLDKNRLGSSMNETSTIVLERLANLNVKSLSIEVKTDEPGLLRSILLPFEEHQLSLTAIDSHKNKNGLKFEIGIDQNSYSLEAVMRVINDLHDMGHTVVDFNEI